MRCHHCHSPMEQTASVAEGGAHQTWHRCPVCAAEQTVSRPCEAQLRRIGNGHRCSSRWPPTIPAGPWPSA